MVVKKENIVKEEKDLWSKKLVEPIRLGTYTNQIADTEKIILFGESNAGKTYFYMKIPEVLKKEGLKPEDVLMCVIFSDRPTGITKLVNLIPTEFVDSVLLFPINNYEELISSTAIAEEKLKEHRQKTGKFGWLIVELLNEPWTFAQDYYSRQAYGETLADYLAIQREYVKEKMRKAGKEDKDTAFQGFEGFKDWTVIKFFHNFQWIDKIKRMPFNVLFTSEAKEEENKDSVFGDLGFRPSGEKSNLHRVDTILYLEHKNNKFAMTCYKLTGYTKVYSKIDITDKNGYEEHKKLLKRLEDAGMRTSKIEEIEKEAGIDFTKTVTYPLQEKTIKTISGTPNKEKIGAISKEELVKTSMELPPKEAATGDTDLPKVSPSKKKEGEDEWNF
jgi:hypothetical protein